MAICLPPPGELPAKISKLFADEFAFSLTPLHVKKPVLKMNFDVCPEFCSFDFQQSPVNEKKEETEDKNVFFTRAQDASLVRGIRNYGLLDLGKVVETEPSLRAFRYHFGILKTRWNHLARISGLSAIDERNHFKVGCGENILVDFDETGYESNEDFCAECGDEGDLLCCDSCPRSFHIKCIDMDVIPETDVWNCFHCVEEQALDIVDDRDLTEHDWVVLNDHFNEVALAKATIKEGPPTGEEGVVTLSLRRIIQADDPDFDRVNREISQDKFVSKSISKAENELLAVYSKKEEDHNLKFKKSVNLPTNPLNRFDEPTYALIESDTNRNDFMSSNESMNSNDSMKIDDGDSVDKEDDEEEEEDDEEAYLGDSFSEEEQDGAISPMREDNAEQIAVNILAPRKKIKLN